MKFHVDTKLENSSVGVDCNESRNPNLQIKELPQESSMLNNGSLPKNSVLQHSSCCDDKSRSVMSEDCYDLAYWGLPGRVISAYQARGINKMFHWQYECISMKDVLSGKNLVYSAPTSAGKTLVAEILMLKKVLETKKKAMMILPFVSVVREKVNYLQEMFQDTGIVVDGYMGAHRPPGGFKAVDIAICTIEKANNLVNRLMEEKQLDELGILVVDELHMLGDNSRGYLLELLLTKLLYNCKKYDISIQIIGMSATLPNLNVLSFWLNAELYYTDFRPVPLHEMYKVGPIIFDSKTTKPLRNLAKDVVTFAKDSDHTIFLTIETVASGNGVLIFCPSKNWCETLATSIAHEIYKVGRPTQNEHKNLRYNQIGEKLRECINGTSLSHILLQLKNSPAGLDPVLKLTVPFGVAFHHAGLTFDERDIVEGAFRQSILKVLVATSTLSSGVNLPARRVLIRSPLFCGSVIDTLSYKQMVGRAGRKGIDDQGESILLCKESERNSALQLVNSELKPVKSCLLRSGKSGLHASLKRAVIEVIASGAATTHTEVVQYASCTLLFASLIHESNMGEVSDNNIEASINKCLDYLLENDFIFKIEKSENDSIHVSYKPSQLGIAILASGFSPEDALRILKELQLARRCFVLENDLHILYEVTPPYLSDQMGSLNWMTFLSIWEQLPDDFRRVGELVGVSESFIGLGIQGRVNINAAQTHKRLAIHQRFYATLALNDLIQEVPLAVVSEKYNCNKGILQSLQQTTSTFSGMLTIFCNRLGWHNLELLFSHFQKRVHFGVQQELCDLVQLSTLNAQRARVLYNAGFETVSSLASADPGELELVLCNAGAFESEKQLDGDIAQEALQRREVKRIRITGKQGVNEREAAILIIKEAQNFIKYELGIKTISWQSPAEKVSNTPESTEKNEIKIDPSDVSQNMQHNNISHLTCNINCESNPNLPSVESNRSTRTQQKSMKLNFAKNNQPSVAVDSISNKDKSNSGFPEVKQESNKNSVKACSSTKEELKIFSIKAGDSNINVDGTTNSNVDRSLVFNSSHNQISLPSQGKDMPTSPKCNVNSNINEPIASFYGVALYTQSLPLAKTPKSSSSIQASLGKGDKSCDKHEEVYSNSSMILQANNLFKSVCEKNESYFCLEDVDDLFNEFEQTVQEIKKEKPLNCVSENEGKINKDLTFSQLLLSQTAETENIYFAESHSKPDFQNFSFSELPCADKSCLSNSRIEKVQSKFTSKETINVLDAIFDSPPSCSMALDRKSKVITESETGTTVQKCSKKDPKRTPAKVTSQFFPDVKCNKSSICKDRNVNWQSIGQKVTSQSTPKLDLNEANCFEDANCDVFSPVLIENSKFDFSELNIHDDMKPKAGVRNSSSAVLDKKLQSETSGDIFESDSEPPDKPRSIVGESEKLEKSGNSDKNDHMFSSCSDEIFTTDKSFENILENNHDWENNICSLKDNCFSGKPLTDHKASEVTHENIDIKSDLENRKLEQNSKFYQLSPTTIKQIALENSGDIFDDFSEPDPVSNDAKKQLSFLFEEHSEMFKSWNPSPNNTVQTELSQKLAPQKENSPYVDVNPKDRSNNSFIANASDFSSFSSDCLEPTPPEKTHINTIKSLLLQTSVSLKPSSLNKNVSEDKVKCKLFEDTQTNQVNDMRSMVHDKITEDKTFSPLDVISLNIIDVSVDKFDSFLTCLKKTPIFSLSVACEKLEKKSVSIGPPNLRGKKSSAPDQKICIDGDVLIAGLSFCWSEKMFFINFQTESSDGARCNQFTTLESKLKLLQTLFHSSVNKKIVAYDIKSLCKVLWKGCHISLPQNKDVSYLDPSIASWLLDPSDGQQTLQELVLNYYPDASHLIEGFDRSRGSLGLQHWSSVPGWQRASTEAYISFHLIEKLQNHLSDKKLLKSFVDVEMPAILTLAEMEQNGLGFNLKLAMSYRKELQKKQDALLKKAHQLAGRGFNIMSSRDLSRILYKELKLNPPNTNFSPAASKHLALGILTRSGTKKLPPELKTNKECLEKIMHLHPLPKTIVNWRKLSFAVSKVLMPLLRENKFDNHLKMHRLYSTCFVYTVTGRVNMHTPNLQFIPRDFIVDGGGEDEYCQVDDEISDYGVSLRDMFVPAEDNILLSADYSQLELRILAHLSGDVKLLTSLNSGDDIFKQIAATWKNMPISCIDGELRQQAKKICYGIIYGMSSKTLSHQLKTTENDAACFMEAFKKSYPGVTNYLDSVVENCCMKGYVTTLLHRRRYLPSILSERRGERAHAERQAINTTIQGSAADIIKIAMIEIDKQLKVMNHNAGVKNGGHNPKIFGCRGGYLVLQLHDELMYEVSKEDLGKVKDIVKTVMERTTKLSVKLPVNIRVGSSWGSMKEVL